MLETSVDLNLNSNDLNIKSNISVLENLNKQSSDKYEYIFPKIELVKNFENKTDLKGDFKFKSNITFIIIRLMFLKE